MFQHLSSVVCAALAHSKECNEGASNMTQRQASTCPVLERMYMCSYNGKCRMKALCMVLHMPVLYDAGLWQGQGLPVQKQQEAQNPCKGSRIRWLVHLKMSIAGEYTR